MSSPETHPVAHQFDDAEQQFEASTLGMWIFLLTEVMFFGGILVAYAVYFVSFTEAFEDASNHLSLGLGALNTLVLLTSSLTMARAVHAAQAETRQAQFKWLGMTILLGLAFLTVKAFEYSSKFAEALVPGDHFGFSGPHAAQHELFMSFYFALTGLHAVHMIIGIAILSVLLLMARQDRFRHDYFTPVEMTGLYWHFVDLVWIFLFPMLYLLGRH
ncbi:MAG: cytochrome c oxidase subunit 3 family protein [Candidatus Binatia bacterium]|nr:cytochrome c oxidase subunit 3 family protein [Candidatus Binatia bacterium]